jgi:hypothetical protein
MFKLFKDLLLKALAEKKDSVIRPDARGDKKSPIPALPGQGSKPSASAPHKTAGHLSAARSGANPDTGFMRTSAAEPTPFQGHCCDWRIGSGTLSLNPLLIPASEPSHDMISLKDSIEGAKVNIFQDKKEESELVMGIDFGTSSTKVVIRDVNREKAFAVPFLRDAKGKSNSSIFPSHVFTQDSTYSLSQGSCISDLKLRLINAKDDKTRDGALADAAAYLALVIRHARSWLFQEFRSRYSTTDIIWKINFGLPARNYEDESLVKTFKELALCAANLSSDQTVTDITKDSVLKYLRISRLIVSGEATDDGIFRLEDVDVVPEIAAQIYGFVRSDHWDRHGNKMMMMVDIGAGTVDSAFFSIVQDRDTLMNRYSFFGVEVRPYGVMNLHRERVDWLVEEVKTLQKIEPEIQNQLLSMSNTLVVQRNSTDQIRAIPESVEQYVVPVGFSVKVKDRFIDYIFKQNKLLPQINRCAKAAFRQDVARTQLQDVPIFLCGGGSRMAYYAALCEDLARSNTVWKFRKKILPRPSDLKESASDDDYDRLSVAYGLSWHLAAGRPLGEFVRSLDIPNDIQQPRTRGSMPDEISKDMV